MNKDVVVEIVEQPAGLNERFRYDLEGKSVIIGENSTLDERTYPAIRLLNYTGAAVVVVSCVFTDDYRAHPHSLINTNCNKGVCLIEFETDKSAPTVVILEEIAIRSCRKAEIEKNLTEREMLRVDPFKRGFKHKRITQIDVHAVRLCFQVLLKPGKNEEKGKLIPVPPVVSNIIQNKNYADLIILDISDATSPTTGGKKIMMFCSRVVKDDIKIRFYKENADKTVDWEAWVNVRPRAIHRQVAIAFETPAYLTNDIEEPVAVFLQLVRPSDGLRGNPCYFRYVPDYSSIDYSIKNKKRKIDECEKFCQSVQEWEEKQQHRTDMEINIKPNTECNNVSYEGAQAAVSSGHVQAQVAQSNLNSNFGRDGHKVLQSIPAQSYQCQQPNCFVQSYSSYAPYHQPQINVPPTQNNSHIQHSHFKPPSESIRSDYQHLRHLQQQPQNFNFVNVTQSFNQQQPPLSNNFQQPVQQPPSRSKFQQSYTNPAYDVSNSEPFPNHYSAMNHQNSTTQNANMLYADSNGTMELQNFCENNLNADDPLENISDSFGSLLIETLNVISNV